MKVKKLGQYARDDLRRGIDACADHTNPTLGPAGKGHLIGRIDLPPRIVDDAVSVVMNLEGDNEAEDAIIMLMREALMTQSKNIKDSTATTMNLIQSITNSVFDKLKTNDPLMRSSVNTVALHKELANAREEVIHRLTEIAIPLSDGDIYKVALSAGTYDWIAKLVTEVYQKIGKNGYVEIKEGLTTGYEILHGMNIKSGYHSEYYINNDKRECVLERPFVFVTNQKLDSEAIRVVIGLLVNANRELLYKSVIFIAPEFTPGALADMAKTQSNGSFTPVALKLPTLDKDDILIDISTFAEAKFMDRKLYVSYDTFLSDIKIETLGRIEQAIIGEGKSKFIGGNGDVVKRIQDIKDLFDKSESPFDKENYARRIASLAGAVAFITIGGVSDQDKGYYRLKVENAVGSVQNALDGGVVLGGGMALNKIADEMEKNLLSDAIRSPYRQIQMNNGSPFEVSSDVLDPVNNMIGAVRTACTIVGSLLLIEGYSVFKRKKEDD